METLIWPMLLLGVALLLILLEVFIPSGGALSLLAGLAIVAAIGVGFSGGIKSGSITLAMTVMVVPLTIFGAVRWFPSTPMGRLMLGDPIIGEDVLPNAKRYKELHNLVGKTGTAKSKMLPSGVIAVDGKSYTAISEGMPIDAGQAVKVVVVRTNQAVVRPTNAMPESDDLSQPADSIGLEEWDNPIS